MKLKAIIGKLGSEYRFFLSMSWNIRVLLITNMIYAFVLPIIEIFVVAYIMRSSNDPIKAALYFLTVYTGIPITFLINGYLLNRFKVANLYSFGMLLSGLSMLTMMGFNELSVTGIGLAGLLMGASFGFFWANRDFLALSTTNDNNRNYYYGLETFFYTITAIIVPIVIGYFLTFSGHQWFGGKIAKSYKLVAYGVVVLTFISSFAIHKGSFQNPRLKKFVYLKFDGLWNKMLVLAILKGLAQGYLVTAPSILIMKFFRNEGSLGTIESICGIITAIMLYVLGRIAKPKHRIYIFSTGYVIFLLGAFFNGVLFSSVGVMLFVLSIVLFRPLHDIAYFPIQMKVINVVSEKENRSEFAYIFNHEFGLYIGRFLGLALFIYLAYFISEIVALKYSLIVIGLIQILSVPLAIHIIKMSYQRQPKNNEIFN
jgi:MFS transporter, YQGE family, putative transporter